MIIRRILYLKTRRIKLRIQTEMDYDFPREQKQTKKKQVSIGCEGEKRGSSKGKGHRLALLSRGIWTNESEKSFWIEESG